jgi:hypothetical protein
MRSPGLVTAPTAAPRCDENERRHYHQTKDEQFDSSHAQPLRAPWASGFMTYPRVARRSATKYPSPYRD